MITRPWEAASYRVGAWACPRPGRFYTTNHMYGMLSLKAKEGAFWNAGYQEGKPMDNQPQQRFCTNCGQPLPSGVAFCVTCGTPVSPPPTSASGQYPAGAQTGYPTPYAQTPPQAQDDQLLTALAAGYVASQMGRQPPQQARQRRRRPLSTLRGCGCLLLMLVILAGPFIGLALTSGRLRLIFGYVAGGMIILFTLLILIAMLATRSGREALSDGCLDAILGGLLGGDS